MSSSSPPGNYSRLLNRLPPDELQRLKQSTRLVNLEFKRLLYKCGAPIERVYFPTSGALSAITVMEDGSAIEVATIGNEGMVGLTVLLAENSSPNDVIVQIAGDALEMDAEVLKREASQDGPLRQLLLRYHSAFLTQVSYSVACNGLHPIQKRCCRWLLMTHDRMESNVVPLTHEYLGIMLGVRRASVTEVLGTLQDLGLIAIQRGAITILDRAGMENLACECYRKVNEEFSRLLG